MAAFTKLSNGSWALKSLTTLVVGSTVLVLKADGSTTNLVVGKLIKTSGGISIYEFSRSATQPANASQPFRHRRCKDCGATPSQYVKIYKNGQCRNCWREQNTGDPADW